MPNKIIVDYLSKNLKRGYNPAQLRNKLLAAGYPQIQVDEALAFVLRQNEPKPQPQQQIQKHPRTSVAKPAPSQPVHRPVPKPKKVEKSKQPKSSKKPKEPKPKTSEAHEPSKEVRQPDKGKKRKHSFLGFGFLSRKKDKSPLKQKDKQIQKKDKPQKIKPQLKQRKRSISAKTVIVIAVIITVIEIGAFFGLFFLGFIDLSPTEYCIEDWGCKSWSPRKCPENATQIRSCSDANNCGTQQYIPPVEQTCVPIEGGPYVFTENDFLNTGFTVYDFVHFTRNMEYNGTKPYVSFISVARASTGVIMRSSVTYGNMTPFVYNENIEIMRGMNINSTYTDEYGNRSERFELPDLGSGSIYIQNNGWFLGIDYNIIDKHRADSLINTFIRKTTSGYQNNCSEDWQCTEWTDCVNMTSTRSCLDANNCGTFTNQPAQTQSCNEP